jgi:hypothetical protein
MTIQGFAGASAADKAVKPTAESMARCVSLDIIDAEKNMVVGKPSKASD